MVVKLESGLISDNLWSIYSFCRCKIVARYMQGICRVVDGLVMGNGGRIFLRDAFGFRSG